MNDLVEFLRARLDEDERVARDAILTGFDTWAVDPEDQHQVRIDDRPAAPRLGSVVAFGVGTDAIPHIARWDPARVLADVEAKRAILAEHESVGPINEPWSWSRQRAWCRRCSGADVGPVYYPCSTVRALARPYRDHPDYRQEWTP